MLRFVGSVLDVVADRTLPELIGALLAALTVALVTGGLFAAGRRRVTDTTLLAIVLAFAASLVSMALTAGHLGRGDPSPAVEEDGPFNGYVFDGEASPRFGPPPPFAFGPMPNGQFNGYPFVGRSNPAPPGPEGNAVNAPD